MIAPLGSTVRREHVRMPPVDIIEPDLFAINRLTPEDIPSVVGFAYRVAESVEQHVYVAVFSSDGRTVGGPPLAGPRSNAIVRLGNESAPRVKWFGAGRDIVLWRPPSREWSCELIARHWSRQPQVCWGVLVDRRDIEGVASNLQLTWPRRHAVGDHIDLLESTIGPYRKLAMLSYDGCWFSGKASPDCWDFVRSLLVEISRGDLEVYEDTSAE